MAKGRKFSRAETSVFALAWRETLEAFPDIVISEQVRIACTIRWFVKEGDEVFEETLVKTNPSQTNLIKLGKTDAHARSIEGLVLALHLYSHEHDGGQSYRFYVERLMTLLDERAADAKRQHLSVARKRAFLSALEAERGVQRGPKPKIRIVGSRKASKPAVQFTAEQTLPTIQSLVEDEMAARGLEAFREEDQKRFISSINALGINMTLENLVSVLEGNAVDEVTLGQLCNVLVKDRQRGNRWQQIELESIRFRQFGSFNQEEARNIL